MIRNRLSVCLVCVLLLSAVAHADVVTSWNSITLDIIRVNDVRPPIASRALAMVHAAIYDSVNAIDRKCGPYVVQAWAPRNASEIAAAATAAYTVLTDQFPAEKPACDEALAWWLSQVRNVRRRQNGVTLGSFVGQAILCWRRNDGSDAVVPYNPAPGPGIWQPTPPAYAAAVLPNWGYVTPFAMTSGLQFRPPPPPSLRSWEYAENVREVMILGALHSPVRTPEQTEIAFFWADDTKSVSPPGRWNVIAQQIAFRMRNTVADNARLFALLNVALADSAICAWDCKYVYNVWRPITAIRLANTDGNPLTVRIPWWTPLLNTPAFPDYTSGHSTFGGAAAEMLALFFGSDNIPFTIDSGTNLTPVVYRSFRTFTQAADENGYSRIYAGIHYQFANVPGISAGRSIGRYVWEHFMRPR